MSELIIENVNKKFGKNVILDDVSLKFEQGHCYGLLGRNGAGKSTLINIIMQRCPRKGGKILLDGIPVDNNDKLLSRMFCMSDSAVYPAEFKLKTIFSITAAMYPSFDKEYAKKLAELFGLDFKKRVGRLSTGYNTIYKVILALASNADFIFLDEPVLGIDVNQREAFYRELARKMSESGSCFVVSTHIIEEMQDLIDRVIILHKGKILLSEETERLMTDYSSVSGKAELVDSFTADKEVIGSERMSVFKTAVIKDIPEDVPDGISCEAVNLQKLFYFLTGGSPDVSDEL
ncbi:MAG: ABC transporter ATP-binding protein [Oscillospiraceae bacterium]|nr:ABC transporter ATP-binding protein [Oscillospiraceae bacterium]